MPHLHAARTETSAEASSGGLNPIYIAGFAVVGAIVLGLVLWLSLRYIRRRAASKREKARGGAFLSVKGLVKEGELNDKTIPQNTTGFSRSQLRSDVVLPEKYLAPPPPPPTATRDDIVSYHRESGTFPRPFAFAMSASRTPSPSNRVSAGPRSSWLSFAGGDRSSDGSRYSRFSVMSTSSSIGSSASNSNGHPRKVRQNFSPVLPDEFTIAIGESLTLVQSFDDGWCVVGRKGMTLAVPVTPFSKPKTGMEQDGFELGVVPAWCFIKPVKGLRAERPVRSTSLGITIQTDGPARADCASWSNF